MGRLIPLVSGSKEAPAGLIPDLGGSKLESESKAPDGEAVFLPEPADSARVGAAVGCKIC